MKKIKKPEEPKAWVKDKDRLPMDLFLKATEAAEACQYRIEDIIRLAEESYWRVLFKTQESYTARDAVTDMLSELRQGYIDHEGTRVDRLLQPNQQYLRGDGRREKKGNPQKKANAA